MAPSGNLLFRRSADTSLAVGAFVSPAPPQLAPSPLLEGSDMEDPELDLKFQAQKTGARKFSRSTPGGGTSASTPDILTEKEPSVLTHVRAVNSFPQ